MQFISPWLDQEVVDYAGKETQQTFVLIFVKAIFFERQASKSHTDQY